MKQERISIHAEILQPMGKDFDFVLRRLLEKMERNKENMGEITLKVKVTVEEQEIYPYSGDGLPRKAKVPSFEHRIQSVVQDKEKCKGSAEMSHEMAWDEENGTYVFVALEDGQIALDDMIQDK